MFEGLCGEHHEEARQLLGDEACAKGLCLYPKFRESLLCRDHFEADAFGKILTRGAEPSQVRRATPAAHLTPVRGLEFSYEIFTDPTTKGDRYPNEGRWRLEFEANEHRQRLYMFAYLNGRMVGHLSAYVHTNNTALFRDLEVYPGYRQRRIGSALYESFRAEHPDLLVDLGLVGRRVRPWWEQYCAKRGLDPDDPRS
jgi:hypothetical protein